MTAAPDSAPAPDDSPPDSPTDFSVAAPAAPAATAAPATRTGRPRLKWKAMLSGTLTSGKCATARSVGRRNLRRAAGVSNFSICAMPTASSTEKSPTAVRRSALTCAPQPSASPRSRASARR